MNDEILKVVSNGESAIAANSATDDSIKSRIFTIRGVQVMLDRDLAELYGVETGALNRQVKRNNERFPEDFMFRLSSDEWSNLKCQNGISRWGGDRFAVKAVGIFHDRFLILGGTDLYHFGASLKDLGRHYCAVTKMDAMFIPSIIERTARECIFLLNMNLFAPDVERKWSKGMLK